MTTKEMFASVEDEFLKFERIPVESRRHERRDVCAFIYLHEKLGCEGVAGRNIVAGAEYAQIYLDYEDSECDGVLGLDDVIYLSRCGVSYDTEAGSLFMFV